MAPDRTAWEYETLKPPRGVAKKEASDPKGRLNELGADGWELVDTVEYAGGGTKFLVLKRPADRGNDTSDDTPSDDTGTDSGERADGSGERDGTSDTTTAGESR